jgi:Ferritin-like
MTRRITSVDDLRTHLQWAIELEHATIPPYLCALYSIDPARNPQAVQVVQSIFVEEMLHLTLAANLLNAVGGRPVLDSPSLLPGYPRTLPHGDRSLAVGLVPFDRSALETFLRIEQPASPGAVAEADRYETIGQFYAAIEAGLRLLSEELGEARLFGGDQARQVGTGFPYAGSGQIVQVRDLASALAALAEIVDQGEGTSRTEIWDGDHQMFDPGHEEVAHYFRLEELRLGRRYQAGDTRTSGPTGEAFDVDWEAIHPMRPNQRIAEAEQAAVRVAQQAFNETYCTLLQLLDQAFDGQPAMLGTSMGAMFGLKAHAQELLSMPLAGGQVAGPTFEYVAPADRCERLRSGDGSIEG